MSVSSVSSDGLCSLSTVGSSVHHGVPISMKCMFMVKGADLDDEGTEYNVSVHKPFKDVYEDYAQRAGIPPRELWLVYHERLLQADATPFTYKLNSGDIVLAYKKVQIVCL